VEDDLRAYGVIARALRRLRRREARPSPTSRAGLIRGGLRVLAVLLAETEFDYPPLADP
jgi:hypothetical protein